MIHHPDIEKHLDPFIYNCESYIDKIVCQADKMLDALSNGSKLALQNFNSLIDNIDETIYDHFNKDTSLSTLIRYGSLPWSIVIPKGYKYLFFNRNTRALIFQPGVHMVRAKVGGGKSLASFMIAEMYLERTGLSSYFTSPVEKPQVTADGEWLYVRHPVIDTNDYYKKGKKVLNFNTNRFKAMHKDERHLEYNPRQSTTKAYKERFLPEQEDEILMRHEGIEYIYKYSQYTKLDSQDMQALTYMHDVETVKDIPIKRWLDTGRFDYIPIRLKFTTYVVETEFDGGMKRKKVGSCKIPVSSELLARFDTHAERYRHAGLPVDYK